MTAPTYLSIVSHYEACLAQYGDTHRGVDWPNPVDAETRYRVMLEVIRPTTLPPVRLLDFGCGTSHLYEHLQRQGQHQIEYSGLDLSAQFIAVAQRKFPHLRYFCVDLLTDPPPALPEFDYVVLNGVFTEKRGLSYEAMLDYFQRLLPRVFALARVGIAFNVMSKHVDWERDDLFHLPFDALATFLIRHLSRDFIFRSDYQLHEYTTYVYRRQSL